jgi:GDPmannose 4,6-dehydratase
MAFEEVGITIGFEGEAEKEVAYVVACSNPEYQVEVGQKVVAVDPAYYRPTEVELLIGDPTKAKIKLGWEPKYDLSALVKEMVAADVNLFKNRSGLNKAGLRIRK